MFFPVGKVEKQLKEIKASIHRERRHIPQFKYIESDCPGAQTPDLDDDSWNDFSLGGMWGGYDKIAWFSAIDLLQKSVEFTIVNSCDQVETQGKSLSAITISLTQGRVLL